MGVPDDEGLPLSVVEALFDFDVRDAVEVIHRFSFSVGWQNDLPHPFRRDEEVGEEGELMDHIVKFGKVGFRERLSRPRHRDFAHVIPLGTNLLGSLALMKGSWEEKRMFQVVVRCGQ